MKEAAGLLYVDSALRLSHLNSSGIPGAGVRQLYQCAPSKLGLRWAVDCVPPFRNSGAALSTRKR